MERSRFLFGQFRRGEANDADTYTATISLLLSEFDRDVILYVTDPRTGLVRTCKFLPDGPEVIEACKKAKAIIAGMRIIETRESAGYRWINNPADNQVGFYNAAGERWEDRGKLRIAAPAKPLSIEQQGQRERAISTALQRVDGPRFEVPLTPDDGGHAERIKADLDRRRAINEQREQDQKQKEQT